MAHIVIKNVGPIKNVELDLKKINVLMGSQSSGKSTISKILCHCQWMEKQVFSNINDINQLILSGKSFYSSLVKYHRLEDYFNAKSKIEYKGDFVSIKYDHSKGLAEFSLINRGEYNYPKITYIPSERNLVAAIPNLNKYNENNDVIIYFLYDWNNAKNEIREQSFVSMLNRPITFKVVDGGDYIFDGKNRIRLTNASSGLQSLIPLYLVVKQSLSSVYHQDRPLSLDQRNTIANLASSLSRLHSAVKDSKTDVSNIKEQLKYIGYYSKSKSLDGIRKEMEAFEHALSSRYSYDSTLLFIEEPEQNLFPSTQQKFVYELLSMLQEEKGNTNSLILTTHSPYVLFAINNCMMGKLVEKNIPKDVFDRVAEHLSAWISPNDVGIYEIEEGKVRCIQDEDGIIEDNYLNQAYKENTAEYLSLLNYYEDEE